MVRRTTAKIYIRINAVTLMQKQFYTKTDMPCTNLNRHRSIKQFQNVQFQHVEVHNYISFQPFPALRFQV